MVDAQRLQRNLTFQKTPSYKALKLHGESSFRLTGSKLGKFLQENLISFSLFWKGARACLRCNNVNLIRAGSLPLDVDDEAGRHFFFFCDLFVYSVFEVKLSLNKTKTILDASLYTKRQLKRLGIT